MAGKALFASLAKVGDSVEINKGRKSFTVYLLLPLVVVFGKGCRGGGGAVLRNSDFNDSRRQEGA